MSNKEQAIEAVKDVAQTLSACSLERYEWSGVMVRESIKKLFDAHRLMNEAPENQDKVIDDMLLTLLYLKRGSMNMGHFWHTVFDLEGEKPCEI